VAHAAGCSRDARRPARTTERDGKWQQDRIVRRLLLPGRRHGAPGGTGCAAATRRSMDNRATLILPTCVVGGLE